jgi:hypothetical protein
MVTIPRLIATAYQGSFSSGRTKPAVFMCEDAGGNSAGEYVVKLIGSPELSVEAMLRELVGSLLADALGLIVPERAIVTIERELAAAISDPELAGVMAASAGNNFGSKNMIGGYVTWPVEKSIPTHLRQTAAEIFAFDMLVQNPDRNTVKPNILWRDERLVLIDHESAFSFVLNIFPIRTPWLLEEQPYHRKHIFYGELKGSDLALERITTELMRLSDDWWEEIRSEIPAEWMNEQFDKMREHVMKVQLHATEFMNDIRRVLS